MAGPPYQVLVDRFGGAPTFGRGELIDAQTAAAMRLEATRLIAAGALVGLGPDIAPLVAGYTGTGPLSARPAAPDVPVGATAFYFATDTGALSTWNGTSWSDSAAHPLKFENWDGVVAPAIPAGWTVDTTYLATSTTESPTSAPNSLVYPVARVDGSAVPFATWATPDGGAGNVQVSATIRFSNSVGAGEQGVALFARCPTVASFAGWGTLSYYGAYLARTGPVPGLNLSKEVGGVNTNFARVGATAFADATNYRVYLVCNGSTIQGRCQRLSDGYWLNDSGVFVADATHTTVAITHVDTALPATAGYAGLSYYMENGGGGAVGVDDWLLEAL